MKLSFVLISSIFFGVSHAVCRMDKEQPPAVRLRNDLLCNYDKNFPPLMHEGNATTVVMSMILKSFGYDSHNNMFSVNAWLILIWKDPQLKWKPEDYKSVSKIHLPSSEIWTPDISIYNSHTQGSPSIFTDVNCLVMSTGSIICVSPTSIDGLCIANAAKFPFDTQNCTLRFGSWVHSGEELNMTLAKPPISLDEMQPNSDWSLESANATKHPGKYSCCPNDTYPSFYFQFIIRRQTAHYVAVIFIPALVMVLLSLTTLWLNPTDPDRFRLMCCNVIAQVLFNEYIAWLVPGNGSATYIAQFSRDSMLLSSLIVVLTVILKNLTESDRDVPSWVPSIVSIVVNNRAGQMILAREYLMKGTLMKNEEDSTNIVENAQQNDKSKDWLMLSKIVDRLIFIIFFIVYISMFVVFI